MNDPEQELSVGEMRCYGTAPFRSTRAKAAIPRAGAWSHVACARHPTPVPFAWSFIPPVQPARLFPLVAARWVPECTPHRLI
jgi:hypothetical protein